MKPKNTFRADLLDLDTEANSGAVLWVAGEATSVRETVSGSVEVVVPFQALNGGKQPIKGQAAREKIITIQAWGSDMVRMTVGRLPDLSASPMFELAKNLQLEALSVSETAAHWKVKDRSGAVRLEIPRVHPEPKQWRDDWPPAQANHLRMQISPDGAAQVPFLSYDYFLPIFLNSVPLGFVEKDDAIIKSMFSLHAASDEKFVGTGERFARMDLAGSTIQLENGDALGVNNRSAYKNVPFYLSNKGYGLFINTHSHARLSLADISTRGLLGCIDSDELDLFFIGGGSPERILWNYRRLTGFPPEVPLWTYGVWMSRLTYFSDEETRGVVRRLRERQLPCDVVHMDTGWFPTEWLCEWTFSETLYPDPAKWMSDLRDQGIRISLWQTPAVRSGARQYAEALEKGYVGQHGGAEATASNFAKGKVAHIDFTNPEAVDWYKGLLKNLLELGACAIKTDFGEDIDLDADYANLPAEQLHNLYALLYQKAAFEVTEETRGEGIIWARAGWAGCQRYPVHWGGDATASWDGMAASLRGGLHLGLSGFGYWSHDCPGFMSLPDPNCVWPSNELFMRWTQFATFSSHFRYHGTQPREAYEYPEIEDLVRGWLNLRYALIPYLLRQAKVTQGSGFPMLRALLMHHPDDNTCWHIDDQFYCGDDILVAPVMNDSGERTVYLPEGDWVDFWSGELLEGGRWLPKRVWPLGQLPVFVRRGAVIPIYPKIVQSTDEMNLKESINLHFDSSYAGFYHSPLADCMRKVPLITD